MGMSVGGWVGAPVVVIVDVNVVLVAVVRVTVSPSTHKLW